MKNLNSKFQTYSIGLTFKKKTYDQKINLQSDEFIRFDNNQVKTENFIREFMNSIIRRANQVPNLVQLFSFFHQFQVEFYKYACANTKPHRSKII